MIAIANHQEVTKLVYPNLFGEGRLQASYLLLADPKLNCIEVRQLNQSFSTGDIFFILGSAIKPVGLGAIKPLLLLSRETREAYLAEANAPPLSVVCMPFQQSVKITRGEGHFAPKGPFGPVFSKAQ